MRAITDIILSAREQVLNDTNVEIGIVIIVPREQFALLHREHRGFDSEYCVSFSVGDYLIVSRAQS